MKLFSASVVVCFITPNANRQIEKTDGGTEKR